jgi:hypothetical protein
LVGWAGGVVGGGVFAASVGSLVGVRGAGAGLSVDRHGVS